MARTARRPPELVGRYFRGSSVVRRGLLTRDQLSGPAWRRLHRDVYVDADVPLTHELRCCAAGLILPPGSAITGRSAACLRGLPLGEPDDPVHVIVPEGRRSQMKGLRVRRAFLPPAHVDPGPPAVTVPERTAWEIARERDLVEAVAALDLLYHWNYVRPEAMVRWVAAQPRSRAAKALALADGRAESPQESRARVRLTLAGFAPPVPQFKIFCGDQFLARVDLAWPAARVAVEYDGVWHADAQQLRKDRARLNKLQANGWTVLHMTSADLRDPVRFARFCDQLRAALA